MAGFRYWFALCLGLFVATAAVSGHATTLSAARVAEIATTTAPPARVQPAQRTKLGEIASLLRAGKTREADAAWLGFAKQYFTTATKGDLKTIVNWVLLEGLLEQHPQLLAPARIAGFRQARQAAARTHLNDLRGRRQTIGARTITIPVVQLAPKTRQAGAPTQVVGQQSVDAAKLDAVIKSWEQQLASAGSDAQLANIDLQNALQKQQQTLQTMSNVSKMLHDTAMAVIRKVG